MKNLIIVLSVMMFSQIANSEVCSTWDQTKAASISKLPDKCGVSQSVANAADCSITPKGKYMCSVSTLNSSDGGDSNNGNNYEPPVINNGSYRAVWAPKNSSLTSLSGFRGHERVSYDKGDDAVKFTQHNRTNRIAEYRSRNGLWVKGDKARMTVDMYIPSNFDSISGRLAIGIYGGNNPNASYISGGGKNSHKVQDGFSVRVNYSSSLKANVYAYNLNRDTDYGTPKFMSKPIPKGQWVTMVLEVNMNTPGKANGSTTLTMYNRSGGVIDSTTLGNMVFRNNSNWDHFGVILTEKTKGSGSYNEPAPKTQSMSYSDYTLEIGS